MGDAFRIGEWLVERDLNLISCRDKKIQIEPKVMEVLVFLAGNPGRVMPRQEILRAVWPGTFVTEDVLTYSVSELRKSFGDQARQPQFIQTIPRRGYRLIAPVVQVGPAEERPEPPAVSPRASNRRTYLTTGAATLAAIALLVFYLQWRRPALTEADAILLADFVNTTGDPVFDDTLKQALAVHLAQTPFLNIYSDERARETLAYMGRSPNEPMTREAGREICLRRGIKALLAGSISKLGREYVISLEALNAQTGDVIVREQFEAVTKEEVLRTLGRVATNIRKGLGESVASIEKFDVPLEQATTASLEAFKAYSLGRRQLLSGHMAEALPYYEHALESDPNFASAYDDIAWCYSYTGRPDLAAQSASRAYSLRDRVSEYERLSIEAIYHTFATGDANKAIEVLELMRAIYPRNAPVHNTLGGRYADAGQLEKAVDCFRAAIRISRHSNAYPQLACVYLRLNRLPEAKETIAQARAQGLDNRDLRALAYTVAFLEGDRAGMTAQAEKAAGQPDEYSMLALQAAAAASRGHLREARAFQQRAIEVAQNRNMPEMAAALVADAARTEALFGNCPKAREYLGAIHDTRSWLVMVRNAQAEALCGEAARARALAEQLAKSYPDHTMIQSVHVPLIRAMVQIRSGDPTEALAILNTIGGGKLSAALWPPYLAGEAYLAQGAGSKAEGEFRKVLERRSGEDPFSPIYILAQLGVSKARRLSGELAKSKESYQRLFALLQAADPDLPILLQARVEYSRIGSPAPTSAY